MTIPDFQTLMLPMLRLHGDAEPRSRSTLKRDLGEFFELTPEDREELLPSGRQRRFDNRIAWAVSYLAHAGILDRPKRGHTVLTERGGDVLRDPPDRIDIGYLERFPEFVEFRYGGSDAKDAAPRDAAATAGETPEEQLEEAHAALNATLAEELLEKLLAGSPDFFEQVVVDVLVAMGYGGSHREAGERLGQSGDGGIDGVIREDALGLDAIYLQAKKWATDRAVGRPDIQAFVGALQGERASKGVFITTSRFSRDADEYAATVSPRVVLVDGHQLARLMIDHGVGVTTRQTYAVKRIDEDYFLDDVED